MPNSPDDKRKSHRIKMLKSPDDQRKSHRIKTQNSSDDQQISGSHDLIKPLDNFMFAVNFRNMESALSAKSLINAVQLNANRAPIDYIERFNCEHTILGEGRKHRGCRLDLSVTVGDHHLNMEVQLKTLSHLADRMAFNAGLIMSSNTASGTDYKDLPKVTVIAFYDHSYRMTSNDYHQPFGLYYEKGERELVTDKIDYHLIELEKFRKLTPDMRNSLHRWLYYFTEGYKNPDNPLMKEAFKMDQGLYEFDQRYRRNLADPKVMDEYRRYQLAIWDAQDHFDTAICEAKAEGRAEGKAEGRAEGRIEERATMIRTFLKTMSVADLAVATGLSHAEIEALAKD